MIDHCGGVSGAEPDPDPDPEGEPEGAVTRLENVLLLVVDAIDNLRAEVHLLVRQGKKK